MILRRRAQPGGRVPRQVLAGAAALGALAAAGQAPLGYWWLALPALAGVTLLVASRAAWRPAVLTAWSAGAGYFAAALFWIVEPFMVDAATDGWMAPFALIFMAGGMALFWALAGAAAALGRGRAMRALGFALGLAATDLLRGYVFTGFPWALAGHIWIGTPVMQAAAWVGPVGLSLLTTLVAAAPSLAQGRRGRVAATLVAAGVLAGLWLGGTARLAAPLAGAATPVHVRLVQPNATQSLKWRADKWDEFIARQFDLTAEPADRPLDLIVWPETSVPWLLDRSGTLLADIAAAAGGVPVAVGIQREEGLRYFNSLAFANARGSLTHVYDKWHLVPFGEYVPFGDRLSAFGIAAFAAQSGYGYSAGPGPAVVDLGRAGRVLPLICYEAVFPQDLRTDTRPDWILQVTNDGWFGDLAGPYQHLAQARLRAVEQGLPLLRTANTGVSAVIDGRGQVLQSLPLNTAGRIDADVPPALPPTPYSRTGDWPATILLLAGLLGLAIPLRHRK